MTRQPFSGKEKVVPIRARSPAPASGVHRSAAKARSGEHRMSPRPMLEDAARDTVEGAIECFREAAALRLEGKHAEADATHAVAERAAALVASVLAGIAAL